MKKAPPYIGVSGYKSRSEVDATLAPFSSSSHKLMIGVIASHKWLHDMPSTRSHECPTRDEFGSIFTEDSRALNLVHYYTDSTGATLLEEMQTVARYAGEHCHGLQLNVKWPSPAVLVTYQLACIKSPRKKLDTIVLQCGAAAMQEVHHDPSALAKRVSDYGGLVDYVLIDASGGKGVPLDAEFASECFAAIEKAVPWLGLCAAGGLSADTMDLIAPIHTRRRGFSIDAQRLLYGPDGCLSIEATNAYTKEASRFLA